MTPVVTGLPLAGYPRPPRSGQERASRKPWSEPSRRGGMSTKAPWDVARVVPLRSRGCSADIAARERTGASRGARTTAGRAPRGEAGTPCVDGARRRAAGLGPGRRRSDCCDAAAPATGAGGGGARPEGVEWPAPRCRAGRTWVGQWRAPRWRSCVTTLSRSGRPRAGPTRHPLRGRPVRSTHNAHCLLLNLHCPRACLPH